MGEHALNKWLLFRVVCFGVVCFGVLCWQNYAGSTSIEMCPGYFSVFSKFVMMLLSVDL